MKAKLSRLKQRLAGPNARLDPLLIAARILLYILLAGVILASVVSLIGIGSYVVGHAGDFGWPLTMPVWRPLAQLLLGLGALLLVARIAINLLRMIATLDRDEAFADDNADRLEDIAGTLLGLQILGLIGWSIGAPIRGDVNGFDLGVDLSPGGIAVVLLLFILARVFRQGAALRSDLEGTV